MASLFTVWVSTSVETYTPTTLRTSGRYKRAWKGTYTHNARKHTVRCIDERSFSFNNRELIDLQRMLLLTSAVAGKRLTYIDLKASI
jgi:hypothetical protein